MEQYVEPPTHCSIHQCAFVNGQCPRCEKRLRGICDVCNTNMVHHRDRGWVCPHCERIKRNGYDPRQPYEQPYNPHRDRPATFNKGRKVAKKRAFARPR